MVKASTYQSTIAGVVVKTTHLYSRWLNFDRVIKYVVEAVNEDLTPDENGLIVYRYKSKVNITSPYRVMMLKPHFAPHQWLYITDLPATAGGGGLVTVRFENWYLFEQRAKLKRDKLTGMLFASEPPKGWE